MVLTAMIILAAAGMAPNVPDESREPHSDSAPIKCETGPVTRTFGGSEWEVYSCEDQASMVVISVQGNPASPFYFFLKPTEDTYRIIGEGNGDKKVSAAAASALESMTSADLAELLAATKVVS